MKTSTKQFLHDVISGLSQDTKTLPCKYLYDETGSRLFEAICDTDEYYVTRADLDVLHRYLPQMTELIGPAVHVIEFGSGAGVKTHHLLQAIKHPRAYTPIEISASALEASAIELRKAFPAVEIRPLQGDYTQQIPSDALRLTPPDAKRLVFFPGSTISNFTHEEAVAFLGRIRNIIAAHEERPGGGLLIGVDLIKPLEVLIPAYNDATGITRDFNRNLLHRINRELAADFDVEHFRHEARYNTRFNRVEMHLVSEKAQQVRINGNTFAFAPGESIHTENSHKYSVESFTQLAATAGLKVLKTWTDKHNLFSTHYLECDTAFQAQTN